MTVTRPAARGANAKAPAKLPALQASRATDPDVQRSLEAVREWLEVRLGSRGDPFEKAITLRELDQALAPIRDTLASYGVFNGTIDSLTTVTLSVLPDLRQGAFAQVGDDLYYCNGKAWRQVTLT